MDMPTYLNAFASKYEKASIESKVYVLKGSFAQDSRTAFGPLFNFVRNWSSKFAPHIESPGLQGDEKLMKSLILRLIFKDGLKHCHRRWVQHKPGSISERRFGEGLSKPFQSLFNAFSMLFLSIFIFSWLSS